MSNKFIIRFGLFLIPFVFIILISNCKKDSVSISPTVTTVQFLGHKGGGNSTVNPSTVENTIPAIQNGLKTMTGIEVDLQMSLDGTIWVFHDPDIATTSCNAIAHKTIILSTDTEIAKFNICSAKAQDRVYKLSEIINYWNQASTPFYLSLHIKLDFPADSMNKQAIGGEALYLSKFADNLAKIIPSVAVPGKIMLEVYDATFCNKIHKIISGIKVCLIKEVTFPKQIDDAISLGYDGVSCIFSEPTLTAAEVIRAQSNGLIIQLWTPDTKQELTTAFDFHPNFIQTNNLNAMSLLNVTVK